MTSLIERIKLRHLLLLIIVCLLCRKSFGQALDFYFWKDDWAWLWSANYNPEDFFHTTIGGDWLIRTGLFMYPYVLYLHKVIRDPYYWQLIGLFLKIVNSILFYVFIKSVVNKKYLATLGAFLFASYSGGIESYTWYKLSALSISFVLLGLTFYNIFLRNLKIKHFLLSFMFISLAFMSNMGRPAGVIPIVVVWGILDMFGKNFNKKKLIYVGLGAIVFLSSYLLLIKLISPETGAMRSIYVDTLNNFDTFLGVIGNLLRNPFEKYYELGYLYKVDKIGRNIGLIAMSMGVFFGFVYLKQKSKWFKYLTLFTVWIFLFYYPNWIFGGGGVSTILGSGHRYLALSGVGIIGLWVILISKLNKKYAIIVSLILTYINLNYSKHLIDIENSVRNRYLVAPIYDELNERMKDDNNVQLVVIDSPNYLKSFVVGGWYPYTFAYYKGLKNISEFPVVIGFWEHAVQWICADRLTRLKIQATGGFGNNRPESDIDINHIYAWSLSGDAHLTDKTAKIREIAFSCLNNNGKN